MKIQTLSLVVGGRACNARCPFCVSKMTGFDRLPAPGDINWNNFCKACRLAQLSGTTTVLLTGKGEPTLYPQEIENYLEALRSYAFPLIELQTNGIAIGRLAGGGGPSPEGLSLARLKAWRVLGLDTIAVSAVSLDQETNAGIYGPDYPSLERLADLLHDLGYTVRLCLMMMRGSVDCPDELFAALEFCQRHGIEQITARPIRQPQFSQDPQAAGFVAEHALTPQAEEDIRLWTEQTGVKLMSLMHGATVYDIGGQNFCLSDCLTLEAGSSDLRSLIFYSDGRLAYDWQRDGAVILGGRKR